MKILEIHEEAMRLSQEAKAQVALENFKVANELYSKAADLESEVVNHYLGKEGLNRSKSIFVRSASFLCLKAGQYERAYRLILEGLRISEEFPSIKQELLDALEIYLSYRKQSSHAHFLNDFNYQNLLALNSIEYIISSANDKFGKALPISEATDFLKNYESSVRAFVKSEYHREFKKNNITAKQLKKEVVPLITSAAEGSLKVSIAFDTLSRGQSTQFVAFKKDIGRIFHERILIPEYDEKLIELFKKRYDQSELKTIFEPVFKIRSSKSNYKVSFKSKEGIDARLIKPIKDVKKAKLITYQREDIVIKEIETVLMGVGVTGKQRDKKVLGSLGKVSSYSNTMLKDSINLPKNGDIILNENLVIQVDWNADDGFTLSNEYLGMESEGENLDDALGVLEEKIETDIIELNSMDSENYTAENRRRMKFYKKLVNDVSAIK